MKSSAQVSIERRRRHQRLRGGASGPAASSAAADSAAARSTRDARACGSTDARARRSRSKHFQKPQRGVCATTAVSAAITGARPAPAAIRRRPVVRRPRQPHRPGRPAAPTSGARSPASPSTCSLRGRRHSFRLRTSLIAAFSSASSAYIRLSFAFSASSSRSRFSSDTVAPAYFDSPLEVRRRADAVLPRGARPPARRPRPPSGSPTIWLSVNRDFRMATLRLAPESLPSNCLPIGEAYASTSGSELS